MEPDDLCNHVHVMIIGAVLMIKAAAAAAAAARLFNIRSPEVLNVLVLIRFSMKRPLDVASFITM